MTKEILSVYTPVLLSFLPLIQKVKANLLIFSLKDNIRADKCHLPWEYWTMTLEIG